MTSPNKGKSKRIKKWKNKYVENVKKWRQRSTFLNPVLFASTQVVRFTSCFSKVRTHHHDTLFVHTITTLCSVNGIFFFESNLIGMFLHLSFLRHIRSPTPSSFRHFKIQRSSQNITIIPSQIIPYHRTPLALASSSKVSFKPSKLISTWLLFSINLTPYIAFIVAFSVLLKIAISFSLRHHVSLPYNISYLTQL